MVDSQSADVSSRSARSADLAAPGRFSLGTQTLFLSLPTRPTELAQVLAATGLAPFLKRQNAHFA
jgi:hypothetical protein